MQIGGARHAAATSSVEANQREENVKRGSFREFALHFDLSAMFLNDAMDDRESESGPVILRREKRIEDVRDILGFECLRRCRER